MAVTAEGQVNTMERKIYALPTSTYHLQPMYRCFGLTVESCAAIAAVQVVARCASWPHDKSTPGVRRGTCSFVGA